MFAKLISETQIEKAPRCIHIGNVTHVLPTEEQYNEAGYYKVFGEEREPARKWYHLVEKYKLEENHIIQYYVEEKDECPDYVNLIVRYIREKYSLNDELALHRQKDNSPEKEEEFNVYNAFCDNCKVMAKADIAEWEQA